MPTLNETRKQEGSIEEETLTENAHSVGRASPQTKLNSAAARLLAQKEKIQQWPDRSSCWRLAWIGNLLAQVPHGRFTYAVSFFVLPAAPLFPETTLE